MSKSNPEAVLGFLSLREWSVATAPIATTAVDPEFGISPSQTVAKEPTGLQKAQGPRQEKHRGLGAQLPGILLLLRSHILSLAVFP